jgi:hypothetical protein
LYVNFFHRVPSIPWQEIQQPTQYDCLDAARENWLTKERTKKTMLGLLSEETDASPQCQKSFSVQDWDEQSIYRDEERDLLEESRSGQKIVKTKLILVSPPPQEQKVRNGS